MFTWIELAAILEAVKEANWNNLNSAQYWDSELCAVYNSIVNKINEEMVK